MYFNPTPSKQKKKVTKKNKIKAHWLKIFLNSIKVVCKNVFIVFSFIVCTVVRFNSTELLKIVDIYVEVNFTIKELNRSIDFSKEWK